MIRFAFNLTNLYEQWHNDKYFSYLEYEGNIKIVINFKTFFCEPCFPILEFLRDAIDWVGYENKTKPMQYYCIDTEENPLISFVERCGKWYIQSPWQKFESRDAFLRDELEKCVLDLEHSVKEQIERHRAIR